MNWPEGRVREMVELFNGYPFASALFGSDGDIPLVRIRDLSSRNFETFVSAPVPQSALLQTGDLVIGMDGDFNAQIWTRGTAALNQRMCALRPRNGIDIRWVAYNLPPHLMFVNETQYATTVKHLSSGEVLAIRFSLPTYREQVAICDLLDEETSKIDALIGKQERLIATLREDRTATITHAVTQGLDPDVVTKDSRVETLGRIPQHWIATPLKHVLRTEPGAIKAGPFGSDLTASEMEGDFAKVYNQRSVLDRDPTAGLEWVSEAKYREMGAFKVLPGDVLVTTRGSIGRAFEVPDDAPIGVIHPCVIRVRADQARLLNEFLLILLNETPPLREQFSLLSNATTIDVIYSGTLASCIVPIPPLAEQKRIVEYVRERRNKIDSLIAKAIQVVDTLREFRSALIADALTGKIDVRGVD